RAPCARRGRRGARIASDASTGSRRDAARARVRPRCGTPRGDAWQMSRIPIVRNALRRAMVLALALVAPLLAPLLAQRGAGPSPIFAPGAEAAMSRGRLAVAESILYAASARAPHDPALRAGLGMYLAPRGHIKIG